MPDTQPVNRLLNQIDVLRLALPEPLTREALCKAAGVNRATLRQLELRGADASLHSKTLAKLAKRLGVSVESLLFDEPSRASQSQSQGFDTPVTPRAAATRLRGAAPAQTQLQGFEEDGLPVRRYLPGPQANSLVPNDAVVDSIGRPLALARAARAYAVYVDTDSMQPRHSRGDLIFVNPDRPPRKGDSAIVTVRDVMSGPLAYLNVFEGVDGEWLVCRQLHPGAEVRFKLSMLIGPPQRVMTINELFAR